MRSENVRKLSKKSKNECGKLRTKDQKIVEECGMIAERVSECLLIDYGSRFCGICGMEIGNEVFCMFKFIGGKPREFLVGIFITKPSD